MGFVPEYDLVRSRRRSLALEITSDLKVLVRAPRHCTQNEIERFVLVHEDWINKHREKMESRLDKHPEPTESEQAMLIRRAKTELPRLVAYYSALMHLIPSGISITGAKKRFGSCSSKKRVCFSWRLMSYPQSAIEYVVVHELAHIEHMNHSKEFHALVASVLPDHKARRKLLKE